MARSFAGKSGQIRIARIMEALGAGPMNVYQLADAACVCKKTMISYIERMVDGNIIQIAARQPHDYGNGVVRDIPVYQAVRPGSAAPVVPGRAKRKPWTDEQVAARDAARSLESIKPYRDPLVAALFGAA